MKIFTLSGYKAGQRTLLGRAPSLKGIYGQYNCPQVDIPAPPPRRNNNWKPGDSTYVLEKIEALCGFDEPYIVIGHSDGAPAALEVAQYAATNCKGLGYLSGFEQELLLPFNFQQKGFKVFCAYTLGEHNWLVNGTVDVYEKLVASTTYKSNVKLYKAPQPKGYFFPHMAGCEHYSRILLQHLCPNNP